MLNPVLKRLLVLYSKVFKRKPKVSLRRLFNAEKQTRVYLHYKFLVQSLFKIKLTRRKIISEVWISFGKGVKDPSTTRKEPLVCDVIKIRQGSETVDPESNPLHFSPVNSRISLDPIWSGKSHKCEHYGYQESKQTTFSACRPCFGNLRSRQNAVTIISSFHHHSLNHSLFTFFSSCLEATASWCCQIVRISLLQP